MTHVKWTGATNPADAEAAVALGVQSVACVFDARSPRYVTAATAWSIRRVLPPTVRFVGVFVDVPAPLVQRIVDQCQLDAAQLFGAETRAEVESIQPYAFKGVTITDASEIERAARQHGRRPKDAGVPGLLLHLTGAAAEGWSAASAATSRVPTLLAGDALAVDRLPGALRDASPWGIDVWSTVERSPGVLDPERLSAVVAAVRAFDEQGVRRRPVGA